MGQAYILFYSIDNDIKLKDNVNPILPFIKTEIISISTSIYKTYFREASEIRINSNENIFSFDYQETRSYRFSVSREEIDLRPEHANFPGTFTQINFIANSNTKIYTRTYESLFEIFVRIGGFLNGIVYSVSIILYTYSSNKILWQCFYNNFSSKDIDNNLNINDEKSKNLNNFMNVKKFQTNNVMNDCNNINRDSEHNNINDNIINKR